MKYYIPIHSGSASEKKVSISSYIQAIKTAKANPERMFNEGLCQWWPVNGAQIYRDYLKSINERINNRAGESWRNYKTQDEIEEERDSRSLCDWLQKRIICRRLNSPRLQKRFEHLLFKD